jgi:hypothetical protein
MSTSGRGQSSPGSCCLRNNRDCGAARCRGCEGLDRPVRRLDQRSGRSGMVRVRRAWTQPRLTRWVESMARSTSTADDLTRYPQHVHEPTDPSVARPSPRHARP